MNLTVKPALQTPEAEEERTALWSLCFGDTREEIKAFYAGCSPHTLCLEARTENRLAGALYLIPATVAGQPSRYGYAVGTHPDFRGKGVCRELHRTVFSLCREKGYGYFLHPADVPLFSMYEGFGMTPCGSVREEKAEIPASAAPYISLTDTTAETFSGSPFVQWEEASVAYALASARRSGGFCKTAEDGACFFGREENGKLFISFCTRRPTEEELSALALPYRAKTAVIRLPGDEIPFLLGFNLNIPSFYTDVIFD